MLGPVEFLESEPRQGDVFDAFRLARCVFLDNGGELLN